MNFIFRKPSTLRIKGSLSRTLIKIVQKFDRIEPRPADSETANLEGLDVIGDDRGEQRSAAGCGAGGGDARVGAGPQRPNELNECITGRSSGSFSHVKLILDSTLAFFV